MRALLSGSRQLWRPLALARWPLLSAAAEDAAGGADAGAEHYAADSAAASASPAVSPWCRLYCGRALARHLVVVAASAGGEADKCRLQVARQLRRRRPAGGSGGGGGGGGGDSISGCAAELGQLGSTVHGASEVIDSLFALAVARAALARAGEPPSSLAAASSMPSSAAAARTPLASVAADYRAVEVALIRWLRERPELAVDYARATAQSLDLLPGPGRERGQGPAAEHERGRAGGQAARDALLASALRRRSCLAFLLEWFPRLMSRSASAVDAGADAGALCPSVAARLRSEAARIDRALQEALAGGGSDGFAVAVPMGVPRSHAWWWWGGGASSTCAEHHHQQQRQQQQQQSLLAAGGGR